jgi:hypothetical protein
MHCVAIGKMFLIEDENQKRSTPADFNTTNCYNGVRICSDDAASCAWVYESKQQRLMTMRTSTQRWNSGSAALSNKIEHECRGL